MESTMKIDGDGTTRYYNENGQLHRSDDLPAVIYLDGLKSWYQHGQLHRDNDLPAVEFPNGTKEWYQHGKRHRDNDLPAIIYGQRVRITSIDGIGIIEEDDPYDLTISLNERGDKKWYQYGELHRENDLPAIDLVNGQKEFYIAGILHRETGPAATDQFGYQEYFIHGKNFTEEEFNRYLDKKNVHDRLTLNLNKQEPVSDKKPKI